MATRPNPTDPIDPFAGAETPATRRRLASYRWRREGRAWARPVGRGPVVVRGVAYLVVAGALLWVSLWLRPTRPAVLVLVGAGYETNLEVPQNVHGKASLDAFRALTRPEGGGFARSASPRLARGPRVVDRRDPWDRGLEDVPEGGALVIVMALRGGSDPGGAYLLPDDASIEPTPTGRIRLAEVLDRIEAGPARSRPVLLVLDAAGSDPGSDWTLGALENGFAEALGALERRVAAIPNLVVLSGSGPGERSWMSDEWRQSTFLHFLAEGLRGHAHPGDYRVDAAGLFDYAARRVADWARRHRGAAQHPVLLPGGAEGRARAARIELATVPRDLAPVASGPTAEPARVETTGWEAAGRLAAGVPHPASYAPAAWSRYLAATVRREELERAGDATSGRAMAALVDTIGRDLEAGRYLTLDSARAGLAMPGAEGRGVPEPSEEVIQRLNSLWGAAPEELARRWKEAGTGPGAPGPDALRTLRAGLQDALLLRVADDLTLDRFGGDVAGYLGRAIAIVEAIEEPAAPRPVEVHDLVMIRRDLPPTVGGDAGYAAAVGLAIRARRLAERTAADVDASPWVAEPLRSGDQARRMAVDLLFSTAPADWKAARGRLDAAMVAIAEAARVARLIREALAVRDEVAPVLLPYTRWFARWPAGEPGRAAVAEVEAVWADLHALIAALEAGPAGPDSSAEAIDDRAGRVRSGFRALQVRFARACDEALAARSPDDWARLDDALRVPFADLPAEVRAGFPLLNVPGRPLRASLIDRARRIGAQPIAAGDEREPVGDVDPWRGARLALAALGPARPASDLGVTGSGQAPPPPELGPAIGRARRGLVATIAATLARLRIGADGLVAPLREADRLARILDGAEADALARRSAPGPAGPIDRASALRRVRTAEFLRSEADRAVDDHWAAEADAAPRPFYRTAAEGFLADADRVEPFRLLPRGPVDALAESLGRPDGLRVDGPGRSVWTSERQVDFAYAIVPGRPGPARPGFPVVWVEAATPLRTVAPAVEARFPEEVGPGLAPTVPVRLEDPNPEAGPADRSADNPAAAVSTVRGLFRGQRFALPTRIDLRRVPDLLASEHPRPTTALLSVRAESTVFEAAGLSRGAVAIVLDASGSMGPARGKAFDDATGYAIATRALEGVLRDLPAGTTLSLLVFGEQAPDGADVPAERTIRTVRPPTRWDASQLAPLMASIRYPAVVPSNESPIVRSILTARDDLLRVPGPGPKSIVVLTDGDDNRFEADPLRGPEKKDIPAVLREGFKDTGIQVDLVIVPLTAPALREKIRAQFQAIQELPNPGRIYDAGQPIELATSLRTVLRRDLTYRVARDDGRAIVGVTPRDVAVSRLDAVEEIWTPFGLPPGGYRVRVLGETTREAPVGLDGGDLLLLTLSDRTDVAPFRRGIYARDFYPDRPSQTDRASRWRLSALRNGLVDGRSLEILATLERLDDAGEGALRLPRPREVWFEVATGGDVDAPVVARWANRDGYPAPAWSLRVAAWPKVPGTDAPARPVVRAWWRDALTAAPAGAIAGDRRVEVRLPVESDRRVDLPGGRVTLKGVQVEDHLVQVDEGPPRLMSCLVVRLEYPKGRPARVEPRGIAPSGHEHRFYAGADAYTGLFWTTTRDEAFAAVDRLEIIDLDDFKALCRRDGTFIELPLEAPRPDSVAPPPVAPPPLDRPVGPTRTARADAP